MRSVSGLHTTPFCAPNLGPRPTCCGQSAIIFRTRWAVDCRSRSVAWGTHARSRPPQHHRRPPFRRCRCHRRLPPSGVGPPGGRPPDGGGVVGSQPPRTHGGARHPASRPPVRTGRASVLGPPGGGDRPAPGGPPHRDRHRHRAGQVPVLPGADRRGGHRARRRGHRPVDLSHQGTRPGPAQGPRRFRRRGAAGGHRRRRCRPRGGPGPGARPGSC